MSDAQNFVLFKRNSQDSSHDDVWDDSALIQAYDRAVNLAKEKVAAKLGLAEDSKTPNEDAQSTSSETQATPSKSRNKRLNWKVGDYVRAVYSEDSVVYEAVIESLDTDSSSCTVKFLGYNNQEEVKLVDLLPTAGPAARRKQISEAVDVYSSDDMECEIPYKSPSSKAAPSAVPDMKWKPVEPDSSFPTHFQPPSHAPMSIPPPPPPSAWPTGEEMDSDALYSMLMSWYMAGYQTGYYQASQQKSKRRHLGS